MRTIKSRKRCMLIMVAIAVLVLWPTKFMKSSITGNHTSSQDADRVWNQADNYMGKKTFTRTQNQADNRILSQADNRKGSKKNDLVRNNADNHIGSKTITRRESETVGLARNKADRNIGRKTEDNIGSKTEDNIGRKTEYNIERKTDNRRSKTDELTGSKISGQKRGETAYHKKHKTGDLVGKKTGNYTRRQTVDLAMKIMNSKQAEKTVVRCIKRKLTHIAFYQEPWAGTTTMEHMFYRFGMRNNLTFALPKTGDSALVGEEIDDILPVKEGAHFDILACHSVYNQTKFKRLLPEDSMKIAIIRDPLERMVSAAYYYRDVMKMPYLQEVSNENFIENLIRNHSFYEQYVFSKTRNSMAKDFGFPISNAKEKSKFISNYVLQLTAELNLVLIMEKFDESLILMKRYLDWNLFDILYIAANSHEQKPVSLSAAALAAFKSVSFLDYAIYEEILKIFELKIQVDGEGFEEEVGHFKTVLILVEGFCNGNSGLDVLRIRGTRWTCPFAVTALDCKFMKIDPQVISMPILIRRHRKMHGLKLEGL